MIINIYSSSSETAGVTAAALGLPPRRLLLVVFFLGLSAL